MLMRISTKQYFEIPTLTQSMIAYRILTEAFWIFQRKTASWECCLHALLKRWQISFLRLNVLTWICADEDGRACNKLYRHINSILTAVHYSDAVYF